MGSRCDVAMKADVFAMRMCQMAGGVIAQRGYVEWVAKQMQEQNM